MKVHILRTPGLDLIHDFAAKGIDGPVEVPKDLAEGDTRDLPEDVAEALIKVGVAAKADKPDAGPKAAAGDKGPHKGTHTPPAK